MSIGAIVPKSPPSMFDKLMNAASGIQGPGLLKYHVQTIIINTESTTNQGLAWAWETEHVDGLDEFGFDWNGLLYGTWEHLPPDELFLVLLEMNLSDPKIYDKCVDWFKEQGITPKVRPIHKR